ncbi:MAG: hypothetical protein K2W85_15405 [Phycisphaerales bacterium]|nr:hypothetical protein [Phycisphaerales bacterium]
MSTPEPPRESAAPVKSEPSDDERTELLIILKDGRRFSGPVVRQSDQEIVISIAGVHSRFTPDQIDRLEVQEPLMERYRKLREAVGQDPDQIVRLAEWLQNRQKYELAFSEVQRALEIDKVHGPALRLKTILEQQIILKANSLKNAPEKPDAKVRERSGGPAHTGADVPLLTAEQINLIKVYETDLKANPRLIITRQTVMDMLEKHSGHPLVPITREGREAILRKSPVEVLDLMFKLQAREFYGQVEVLDQPKPFVELRDAIGRSWLINSCATSQCHGGTEAGRLVLANRRPNAETTLYTNFLIMTRYVLADGTPLIDWEEPEKSPLLQMGLLRDRSRRPHPVIPRGIGGKDAWRTVFRSEEDDSFKEATAWIKSLYRPRPDYPIEYEPLKPLKPPPPQSKDGEQKADPPVTR